MKKFNEFNINESILDLSGGSKPYIQDELDLSELKDCLPYLKKVNNFIIKQNVINWFNQKDIDYYNMGDLDMYIYYIEHN